MILSFRLGAIPVRIHAWLPLLGVLLAMGSHDGVLGAAVRVLGFVATLFAHELSHAAVARRLGAPAEVDVASFRGVFGAPIASLSPARRIVVCLAGPLVNLVAGTIAFALIRSSPSASTFGAETLRYLAGINLGWGLLNLLPILPLDAAQAFAAALDRPSGGRGEPIVRRISIGLAVVLGCAALAARMIFPVLVSGLVAVHNARALGLARELRNREAVLRVHLHAAHDALEREDTSIAVEHCRTVLATSTDPMLRRDAIRLLAYAHATCGDWSKLVALLELGGAEALDGAELERYQRAARELGRFDDARRIALLRGRVA
jgi:Zn-dependent protease